MSVELKGKEIAEKIITATDYYKENVDDKHVVVGIITSFKNKVTDYYTKFIENFCNEQKFEVLRNDLVNLNKDTAEETITKAVEDYNIAVSALILVSPVSEYMDIRYCFDLVYPWKDVEGITYSNIGSNMRETYIMPNPRVRAIGSLIDYNRITTKGKHVVILGRSIDVGKQLANVLSDSWYSATVTMCNSNTPIEQQQKLCSTADIVITTVPIANHVTKDMINSETILIDASLVLDDDGNRLPGVSEEAKNNCSFFASHETVDIVTAACFIRNIYYAHFTNEKMNKIEG